MLEQQELLKLNQYCKSDPILKQLICRLYEDYNYSLSRIAHELRNPLTLIHSTLQMIESKYPQTKEIKYWTQLKSDVKDIISMTDDITAYNKIDELHYSSSDLYELLQNLKESFQSFASERGTQIILYSATHFTFSSYPCDRIKLKQAFTNIIKNALESLENKENGELRIILSEPSPDNEKYFSIIFQDNGSPIPESILDKLFEPFITEKTCGTGIGLTVARQIITQHLGYIQVHSDQNRTAFTVYLPVNPLEISSLQQEN